MINSKFTNIYIKCLKNNTISTLNNEEQQTIKTFSTGYFGFNGAKRATRFAAQELCKQIKLYLLSKKLNKINLFISGFGKGRTIIVKTLKHPTIEIRKIIEISKKQHNGCKLRKKRRI
jgi:ribosomal protein S11